MVAVITTLLPIHAYLLRDQLALQRPGWGPEEGHLIGNGVLTGHLQTCPDMPKEPAGNYLWGERDLMISELGGRSKITAPHPTVSPRKQGRGPQQIAWEPPTGQGALPAETVQERQGSWSRKDSNLGPVPWKSSYF